MLQRWQWQRWDSSGNDNAEMTMCSLVWQRWQLTVLWQRCPVGTTFSAHRCHTNVNISVTALSVVTPATMCTEMFSIVNVIVVAALSVYIADTQMLRPALSQCYLHVAGATAATSHLITPLSQYCHYNRCHTSSNCHRCDISLKSQRWQLHLVWHRL